jgi:hypothetical protein
MISTQRKGNYRKLQFNALNKSSELIITHGLVVLDKAKLSYCNQKDIVVSLTYQGDEGIITKKKSLSQFTSTPTGTGYNVDFLKNVTVSCWVNITQPSRLKIDVTGMGSGTVFLECFVLRLS